jgi:hypothetical protein
MGVASFIRVEEDRRTVLHWSLALCCVAHLILPKEDQVSHTLYLGHSVPGELT